MIKSCLQCSQTYEITDEDLNFYDKISPIIAGKKYPIPAPTLCPDCRNQRRLAFRNERKLYSRKCDATGNQIMSIYSPGKPYKIYDQNYWLGDKWDASEYGMEIDLKRPFIEQFNELLLKVPHPAAGYRSDSENCDYTTYQNNSKNCYLTFGSGWMEDCAYCNWVYYSKNAIDCLGSDNLELCYEIIDCDKMYNCRFCQDCSGLTDCEYCYDCHSCQNCFGCVGLRQKKYCFLNEQLSEEDYKNKIKNLTREKSIKDFASLKAKTPHRAVFQLNCENCTGDHLIQCKNVKDSFQMTKSQDCRFSHEIVENKDCYDCNRHGLSEICCEVVGGGFSYKNFACIACSNTNESYYIFSCFNSKYLFACASLKNKQYCILNKQYSKEEYEKLVPQIIERMTRDGQWGEFFPAEISPFNYDESLAQDLNPLDKKPIANPKNTSQSIENTILTCGACDKNYKIIRSELEYYKKTNLPVPTLCPDCRLENRLKKRNPRKLYPRACAKCKAEIRTTYSPERPEMVYCESCYLKAIY